MLSKPKRPHLGIFVPVAVVTILVASVVAAGAASASRIAPRQHHGIQGIVTAITGGTGTPVCGTTPVTGTVPFTLTGMHHGVVTVDVTTATTFSDPALTTPTFANVCVGSRVIALGTLSSGVLAATLVTVIPAQAQGIVTAIPVGANTTTTPICGTASASGTLTLGGGFRPMPVVTTFPGRVTTVDVAGTTTFADAALTSPSSANFTNVCVGSRVIALGTLSSGVLAATLVTVVPAQAQGIVTAITGGTGTPVCGTTSVTGTVPFTLGGGFRPTPVVTTFPGLVTTVDVTGTTTFTDPALASPSSATFANVCVGSRVIALGTLSSGVLTATLVTVVPPPPARVQGIVTSMPLGGNGGTPVCGTLGALGTFTLTGMGPGVTTVDVTTGTSATAFTGPGKSTATFANVCVGSHVMATGALSAGTLTATSVVVLPPFSLSGGNRNRRGLGKG
ncbi:MAG: hypothetical protein ACLQRH_25155 [Acidimicrobiales bacterium]